ncbi:hypothetical protein Tco_1298366, partial [Tanacetum coccineum]
MTIGNNTYGFRFAIPGDPDRNRTAIGNDRTRSEIAKGLAIPVTMLLFTRILGLLEDGWIGYCITVPIWAAAMVSLWAVPLVPWLPSAS